MRLRVLLFAAALLCGAAAVSTGSAAAAGEASFALKPVMYDPTLSATKSYFILSVKPGAVVRDQVRLVNTGARTGTAYLYPVDATTGQTSGAVYLSRQSPRRDVGAWIKLSRTRVTLPPGANAIVAFTIHVPASLRPGDHLGGIVAENAQVQQSSGHGSLQIKIRHLTIDAVEVQLPGRPIGRVEATGVKPGGEHGYQYVYLHLKSTGTVMIKPAANLTVRNANGRTVAQRALQLDTFVPGTEIDYPALLPKQALGPGRYTAEVRLRSTKNRVLGYRKADPAPFDVTRRFSFTVTSREQTKVYSGAAPVTSGSASAEKPSSRSNMLLAAVVGVLALLVIAILVLLFVLVRRVRRGNGIPPPGPATSAAAAAPPEPVVPPLEEDEEPGWAGLLAAYESEPRHRNGWQEHDGLEKPVPVAAARPADEAEPQAEPEPEPEPTTDAYLQSFPVEDDRIEEPGSERLSTPPVARARSEADVSSLSSALLEASLVALAALVAARLLKSDG